MVEQEKAFDPTVHLTKITGKGGEKLYLPVAARVLWFREDFPIETGWEIRTACVEGGFKDGYTRYRAEIVNPEGRIVASGENAEDKNGFADFAMKAETGAIGRALASCGYGTMAAMDEGEIVDTPIQRGAVQKTAQSQQTNAPAAGQQSRTRGSSAPVGTAAGSSSPKAGALGAGDDVPALAPVAEFWCAGCGQQIKGTTKRSAAEVARLSREGYGQELCVHCVQEKQTLASANVPAGQIA